MTHPLVSAGLVTLGLALSASAQVSTPAQFKAACENSPNNTINISVPVKISAVPNSPAVAVNSGCRLVFGVNGKFEGDLARFVFAGPLVFQGTTSTEIAFVKSLFQAPSIQVTGGRASALSIAESSLVSTSGNVTMSFGSDAKLTVSMPFAGRVSAIESAGAIQISGGSKFEASFSDGGAEAATGLSIAMSGVEATVTAVNSPLTTDSGALSITATGAKATFDLSSTSLSAGSGIVLSARGAESQVSVVQTEINSGAGSVTVESAVGAASFGVLKLAEVNIVSGGSVLARASQTAQKGEAVLEVSTVQAQGSIQLLTGANGTTTATNNGLTSPTLIRTRTGAGGSCVAEGNTAVAPTLQLCQ